jgi:hypothetical protein
MLSLRNGQHRKGNSSGVATMANHLEAGLSSRDRNGTLVDAVSQRTRKVAAYG